MKHFYKILLFFPLSLCSPAMASEQIPTPSAKLNDFKNILDNFKNSITQDPTKTAEFFLSNALLKKDSEAVCRIVEYLPLEKKLIALNSILDACEEKKIGVTDAGKFFQSEPTNHYVVVAPNMQLACNYYVPAINELIQRAKRIFSSNEQISREMEYILNGQYRKDLMTTVCTSPFYIESIPFLSPNKGFWASLPSNKTYSFKEQSTMISQYAKHLDSTLKSISIASGNDKESKSAIKTINENIIELKSLAKKLEDIRPINDQKTQNQLINQYLDDLSYVFCENSLDWAKLKSTKTQQTFAKQLEPLLYPDCYLLEWAVNEPLDSEVRNCSKTNKLLKDNLIKQQ